MEFNIEHFEQFISEYPIFEYRLLKTDHIQTYPRVRHICKEECERYNSTWACPPAVGTIEECKEHIHQYPQGIFFSSVAEVSDILNFEETLTTRQEHEALTNQIEGYLREQGFDVYSLSTESCDICPECAYPQGKPCRHPERMHPCLESHGVMVSELVEQEGMEYTLGGNAILWFSLILFRKDQ
ncbi:MAG: DUF2284 domain-containing protein [Eubacteriales bacterium]|nr:DUF2284 domain-containing protein [Eubacteriales bacterium]